MTGGNHSATQPRPLTARRIALLATVAGLGLGALFVSPGHGPQSTLPGLTTSAQAQNVTQEAQTVARPVGFADVVEKVKPAVISVRVKVESNPQVMGFDGEGLPPGLERFSDNSVSLTAVRTDNARPVAVRPATSRPARAPASLFPLTAML